MKFLIINGKLARMSNGDFITVPDNYNNEPLTINGKLLTVGGAIVGKNFTGETQLATPQNVTADGTTVSWDAVENATSDAILEGDNNVLGTVKASFTLSARNNEALVPLKYKKDGIVTSSDYDGILNYTPTPTNIEGIKSYITFEAFGNEDTMPISGIYNMVNCTAEQVSAQVAKLILTGDASATLNPRD